MHRRRLRSTKQAGTNTYVFIPPPPRAATVMLSQLPVTPPTSRGTRVPSPSRVVSCRTRGVEHRLGLGGGRAVMPAQLGCRKDALVDARVTQQAACEVVAQCQRTCCVDKRFS